MAAAAVNTDDYALDDIPEPSLRNLVQNKTLKWIFVGGKGGVGKTTTSSCLAIRIAEVREKVLIVSTDPAHNLSERLERIIMNTVGRSAKIAKRPQCYSDAFAQKFTREPTLINGFTNLFCMEIDPNAEVDDVTIDGLDSSTSGMASMFQELTQSIPGIDEAMGFAEIMKQVQSMDYSVIIFDTAPTGHTLRLLSFPSTLEKAFSKILSLKSKFGGMFNQMSALMGGNMPSQEMLLGRLEQTKEIIDKVNAQFKDPDLTTFVCVCIPEFLSLYETERLVQELTKFEIDTHNIVVNQVLFIDDDSTCRKCKARQRMQQKYIDQIYDLYTDFHVVEMPLLDQEVRGVPSLQAFSMNLINPYSGAGNGQDGEKSN